MDETESTEELVVDTLYHIRQHDLTTPAVSNTFDRTAIQELGGSATGILSRISGVSIQSGGLISFRGLSSRYTNVTVDGLAAPISQQNIKAFALGLLPPTLIQEMDIYKSGNYKNQGEWGGALLDLRTSADISKEYNKVSLNFSFQQNFTFNTFIQDADNESSFGDYFGFGVDRRDFTNDIVKREELQDMTRNEAAEQGSKLSNNWALEQTSAIPGIDLAYSMGRIVLEEEERKLSTINSIRVSRNQSGFNANRANFQGYVFDERGEVIDSEIRNFATDGVYSTTYNTNLNSAWFYQIEDDHALNLDLTYTNQSENRTLAKYFVSPASGREVFFAQYGLKNKQIFLTRLSGEHEFFKDTDLSWSIGYSNSGRREPDLRRAAAQRTFNSDQQFLLVIPESSKADQGARFNSDMDDNAYSGRFDIDHDFIDDIFELKAGFLIEANDRDFSARIATNAKDDFTDPALRLAPYDQLSTIFESENFGPSGFFLVDGTTDFDKYSADNLLLSGYAGLERVFGDQWRTSLGVRLESFDQNLVSGDVDVETSQTNLLPVLDINYQPNKQSVIKFAYSRSLNRPAFRELAPFTFFDFDYRADVQGNPELKNAILDNYDLSFLYNFGRNEYFSISSFYKRIKDPIEMIYIIRSDQPLFTFDNAEQAEMAGVELELAKILSPNSASILSNIMFVGSLSFTSSSINLGENSNESATSRPLQGQIPLLFSGGLTYFSPNKFSTVTLAYQYVGQSLFSVGDGQETFPWYNAPQNFLNASYSLAFAKNLEFKLSVLNILNTRYTQIEDTDLNNKINDSVDNEVQRGFTYQTYNFSIGYKF